MSSGGLTGRRVRTPESRLPCAQTSQSLQQIPITWEPRGFVTQFYFQSDYLHHSTKPTGTSPTPFAFQNVADTIRCPSTDWVGALHIFPAMRSFHPKPQAKIWYKD